jgi:hypothetical protein
MGSVTGNRFRCGSDLFDSDTDEPVNQPGYRIYFCNYDIRSWFKLEDYTADICDWNTAVSGIVLVYSTGLSDLIEAISAGKSLIVHQSGIISRPDVSAG